MVEKLITKEDILKEIAEETGKSLKVVTAVVNYNLKYLKNIIEKDPETLAINLPNLGILKANYTFNLTMADENKVCKRRLELLRDKDNLVSAFAYKKPLVYTINGRYKTNLKTAIKRYYPIVKAISLKSHEKNNEIFS